MATTPVAHGPVAHGPVAHGPVAHGPGPTAAAAGTATHVVDRLVAEQLLHPGHRERALGVVASALQPPTHVARRSGTTAVVEVVAYLGAALVLAAGSSLGSVYWSDLGLGAQVAVLLVALVALGAGGVATARGHVEPMRRRAAADEPRRRLASTLLAAAALTAGTLVAVLLDQPWPAIYGTTDSPWSLIAASAVCSAVALLARGVADSALVVLVAFGSLVVLVVEVVSLLDDELLLTAALLVVAAAWLVLTELRQHHDPTLARVLGCGLALWAAQVQTWQGEGSDWLGYLLTVLVVAAGTAAYLRRGAWPYLAVAVVGVTVVVPEMIFDRTDGGLGAIGAVLLTGVTLLAASGLGALLRARRTAA